MNRHSLFYTTSFLSNSCDSNSSYDRTWNLYDKVLTNVTRSIHLIEAGLRFLGDILKLWNGGKVFFKAKVLA